MAPSSCEIIAAGIVIPGALPPIANGSPGTLFATTTATAPAACAFSTFCVKGQLPRSTSAIAPAGKPTSGLHPSDGSELPSLTRATLPATPATGASGPKLASTAP